MFNNAYCVLLKINQVKREKQRKLWKKSKNKNINVTDVSNVIFMIIWDFNGWITWTKMSSVKIILMNLIVDTLVPYFCFRIILFFIITTLFQCILPTIVFLLYKCRNLRLNLKLTDNVIRYICVPHNIYILIFKQDNIALCQLHM